MRSITDRDVETDNAMSLFLCNNLEFQSGTSCTGIIEILPATRIGDVLLVKDPVECDSESNRPVQRAHVGAGSFSTSDMFLVLLW